MYAKTLSENGEIKYCERGGRDCAREQSRRYTRHVVIEDVSVHVSRNACHSLNVRLYLNFVLLLRCTIKSEKKCS